MLNSIRKVRDLRMKHTCGRTKQQNPGKRESVGKAVADSNNILNLGEAGGLGNASHVKGESGVTIEESLAATQNRIRVQQNNPQVPICFFCGLNTLVRSFTPSLPSTVNDSSVQFSDITPTTTAMNQSVLLITLCQVCRGNNLVVGSLEDGLAWATHHTSPKTAKPIFMLKTHFFN